MTKAILKLTYERARALALRKGASIGREGWSRFSCLVLAPDFKDLVLVYGGHYYMWEPKSVDLAKADWMAVLPAEDA